MYVYTFAWLIITSQFSRASPDRYPEGPEFDIKNQSHTEAFIQITKLSTANPHPLVSNHQIPNSVILLRYIKIS